MLLRCEQCCLPSLKTGVCRLRQLLGKCSSPSPEHWLPIFASQSISGLVKVAALYQELFTDCSTGADHRIAAIVNESADCLPGVGHLPDRHLGERYVRADHRCRVAEPQLATKPRHQMPSHHIGKLSYHTIYQTILPCGPSVLPNRRRSGQTRAARPARLAASHEAQECNPCAQGLTLH